VHGEADAHILWYTRTHAHPIAVTADGDALLDGVSCPIIRSFNLGRSSWVLLHPDRVIDGRDRLLSGLSKRDVAVIHQLAGGDSSVCHVKGIGPRVAVDALRAARRECTDSQWEATSMLSRIQQALSHLNLPDTFKPSAADCASHAQLMFLSLLVRILAPAHSELRSADSDPSDLPRFDWQFVDPDGVCQTPHAGIPSWLCSTAQFRSVCDCSVRVGNHLYTGKDLLSDSVPCLSDSESSSPLQVVTVRGGAAAAAAGANVPSLPSLWTLDDIASGVCKAQLAWVPFHRHDAATGTATASYSSSPGFVVQELVATGSKGLPALASGICIATRADRLSSSEVLFCHTCSRSRRSSPTRSHQSIMCLSAQHVAEVWLHSNHRQPSPLTLQSAILQSTEMHFAFRLFAHQLMLARHWAVQWRRQC
jgi:hypothetical protein